MIWDQVQKKKRQARKRSNGGRKSRAIDDSKWENISKVKDKFMDAALDELKKSGQFLYILYQLVFAT